MCPQHITPLRDRACTPATRPPPPARESQGNQSESASFLSARGRRRLPQKVTPRHSPTSTLHAAQDGFCPVMETHLRAGPCRGRMASEGGLSLSPCLLLSLCLSLSLLISLPLSVSLCVSHCLSLSLSVSPFLSVSPCLSPCLCPSLSFCLSLSLSHLSLSLCLSLYFSLCLYLSVSPYLSQSLSVSLSLSLSSPYKHTCVDPAEVKDSQTDRNLCALHSDLP